MLYYMERTSLGKSGASASNLPIFPSLNVNRSFLIHSCCVPFNASRMGCINYQKKFLVNLFSFFQGSNIPILQNYKSYPQGKPIYPNHVPSPAFPQATNLSPDPHKQGKEASVCNTARSPLLPSFIHISLSLSQKGGRDRQTDLIIISRNTIISRINSILHALQRIKDLPRFIHVRFCAFHVSIKELGMCDGSQQKNVGFLRLCCVDAGEKGR